MTALASSPALPFAMLRRPARPKPAPRTRLVEATLVEHLDTMYRFGLSLSGSPHEAQDIVQDVCVRLLSRPRHLDRGRERAYLLTAVRNVWLDRLRAQARRPQRASLDAHADVLASSLPEPHEVVHASRVYDAIAGLSEAHRHVVAAVDVAGLSYADAAKLLGVPVGTVMSRLHRGRSRVAAVLQPAC